MLKAPFLILLLSVPFIASAQNQIRIVGTIDGTDRIIIRKDVATWEHLFGDLSLTEVRVNGVLWQPSQNATLENSGATVFFTNNVNFFAARLQVTTGRDTAVLQREHDQLTLSIADTPGGPGTYDLLISFPAGPTLLLEADIDGSDELHISYAGARWVHKYWSSPTNVRLNGVQWNPTATPFLLNDGATTFLPDPVDFTGAAILEQSGRDLLTARSVGDGLIINFADNPVGGDRYSALISFPAKDSLPNNLIPVVATTAIEVKNAAAISINTVRGVRYELQSLGELNPTNWKSTGAFLEGNGDPMIIWDPMPSSTTKFYRVVSQGRP